jgi:hypothetical protein
MAARGVRHVSMISPVGRTTSSERTRSSILPYFVESCPAPRAASQPPTVEQ